MKYKYKDKNWRVTYTKEKISGSRVYGEHKFDNYETAEEKATILEKSPNAHDVKITIWDGDACIEEMV